MQSSRHTPYIYNIHTHRISDGNYHDGKRALLFIIMNPIIILFIVFSFLLQHRTKCEKNKIKTGKTKQNNKMLWVAVDCNVFRKKRRERNSLANMNSKSDIHFTRAL